MYLFKKGRRKRLENLEKSPSEFFYCYKELINDGFGVELLEELDLNIRLNNILINKCLNLFSKLIFNLPLNSIYSFITNKGYKKLRNADSIVTTTNSLGITMCIAKNLGLIKANILFINMGIFSKYPNFAKLFFYKYLFKKTTLLTISKTEYQILNKLFNDVLIKYLPFGVDESFWYPRLKNSVKPYVLAIGNDLARDWQTLIKAWEEDFPTLKIITSLPISNLKKNIEVIKGNWHYETLTDIEMRDLYQDSEFVIVPLKETFQPSGQSTCLQAMACSKAVLISDIKGIWDKQLLKHKENIFFVKSGDKEDLNLGIRLFLKDIKLRESIAKKGRQLIINHFNIVNMKNKLIKVLEEE